MTRKLFNLLGAIAALLLAPTLAHATTTLKVNKATTENPQWVQAWTINIQTLLYFQWSTDRKGAVGGNWQVTTTNAANQVQIVAKGQVGTGPFTLPATSFLQAMPPKSPVKYNITITPHDAANHPLDNASPPVVITQVGTPNPQVHFGDSANYPNLELVSYALQAGQVSLTQLRYALATVTVRVSNKGAVKTAPIWLSVKDAHAVMRQDGAPVAIDSLQPGALPVVKTLHLKAVLTAPQSQLPEDQQYTQWQQEYAERCGIDLQGVMDWRGPQAETPISPHSEVNLYRGFGNSDHIQTVTPEPPFCDTTQCVLMSDVAKNIHKHLDGKVVGYAFFLGGCSTMRSEGYGYAIAPVDGARPFTPSTKMHIASASKAITALAAIRVLAKVNLGPNQSALDLPLSTNLPQDWLSADPRVKAIKFRQLLSHTSGIKEYGPTAQDYATLKQFFTQPIPANLPTTPNPATDCPGSGQLAPIPIIPTASFEKIPCYSNYNFAVFRLLLPRIEGVGNDDPAQLAAQYVNIVNAYVFVPVGVTDADCKPPLQGDYALAYAFPGTSKGLDWGDQTLQCGAKGWVVSVEELAKVLLSLNGADGKILAETQFQEMEMNPPPAPAGPAPIGWDCRTSAPCQGVNGYRWVEKNGGLTGGAPATNLSTSIAIFGGANAGPPTAGAVGVLFINSDIANAPGVGANTILFNAFQSAAKPKP